MWVTKQVQGEAYASVQLSQQESLHGCAAAEWLHLLQFNLLAADNVVCWEQI